MFKEMNRVGTAHVSLGYFALGCQTLAMNKYKHVPFGNIAHNEL